MFSYLSVLLNLTHRALNVAAKAMLADNIHGTNSLIEPHLCYMWDIFDHLKTDYWAHVFVVTFRFKVKQRKQGETFSLAFKST